MFFKTDSRTRKQVVVGWIRASNPPFRSHRVAFGTVVCLSAKPPYVLTTQAWQTANLPCRQHSAGIILTTDIYEKIKNHPNRSYTRPKKTNVGRAFYRQLLHQKNHFRSNLF